MYTKEEAAAAKRAAHAKYEKKLKSMRLSFNRISDADVIEWAEKQENVTDAIRQLIRLQIRNNN